MHKSKDVKGFCTRVCAYSLIVVMNFRFTFWELPFCAAVQKIVTMNTNAAPSTGHDLVPPSAAAGPHIASEPIVWYMHHASEPSEREELKNFRGEAKAAYMRLFGERCKAARGSRDITEVADTIGVHRNTIYNFERGTAAPDAFELEVLAKLYETTTDELLHGRSARPEAGPEMIARSVTAVEQGGFIYVPLFDVRVSAGTGSFNDVEAVTAMRPFDAEFIRRDLGISHNELAMSVIIGTSAEPWLHSRDTVLTDLRDREARTEGLHIVRLDGALLLKKLQRLPDRVLRVSSYNEAYEPFDIKGHEDSDRDFAVIGRVRWGGVTFN